MGVNLEPVTSWPSLAELAGRYGIACDFWDWQGNHTQVAIGTIQALLWTFGVSTGTEEEVQAAIRDADEAPWRRTLPPVVVARQGGPTEVLVHVPHGSEVSVFIRTEQGERISLDQWEHNVEPHEVDGRLIGEARFGTNVSLPLGYHRLLTGDQTNNAEALLIVAPPRLDLPPVLRDGKAWGLMTQLYSVRSAGSWGLGDFADLAALAAWGADLGAEFVLVNPLHATQPVPPLENSPYLPTSRRYLNPIYLRPEEIEEYGALDAATKKRLLADAAPLREANSRPDLLDRNATWSAKLQALQEIYAVPRSAEREASYQHFRELRGQALTEYATWCAFAEHFAGEQWPDDVHRADSPGVAALADLLRDRIEFFAWLQWLTDEQLGAAQAVAKTSGMSLGLVTDLAVGVHPAGAEVWTLGPVLATGASVGAPPDAFNQLGQNWSQPPWRPELLAEAEYEPYRAMLRTALTHAGGVRIDHVMGLFRLWCIPDGAPASQGAYVRYDYEAMVSILLLEAHRSGAFVVGEDLGVVEPFVRDYLAERGVLGTSILWFEVDDGTPRPPEAYRELCLATVTTHDLPPTAGYLAGEHVHLRESLGLLTRPMEEELAFAAHERDAVLHMLRERGMLSPEANEEEIVSALHCFLASAPSKLVGVMVSDLVGDRRTQNQPGTFEEYPNWRVPLTGPDGAAVSLDDLADNERAHRLAAAMNARLKG